MIDYLFIKDEIYRGNDETRSLPFFQQDEEGNEVAIDLQERFKSIEMELRSGPSRDDPFLNRKSLENGDLIIQDTNVLVYDWDKELACIVQNGTYYFDLQFTYQDDSCETWIRGELTVTEDITR